MPSIQNTFNACMMHLCSSTAFNVTAAFNVARLVCQIMKKGKIITKMMGTPSLTQTLLYF